MIKNCNIGIGANLRLGLILTEMKMRGIKNIYYCYQNNKTDDTFEFSKITEYNDILKFIHYLPSQQLHLLECCSNILCGVPPSRGRAFR